jgi:hypothetical protein
MQNKNKWQNFETAVLIATATAIVILNLFFL